MGAVEGGGGGECREGGFLLGGGGHYSPGQKCDQWLCWMVVSLVAGGLSLVYIVVSDSDGG